LSKLKLNIKEWVEAILIALSIVLVVRVFIFEAFTIPTSSMEQTLLPGDFIIVDKISTGSRIPISLLTLPFTHQTLPWNHEKRAFLEWIKLPYFRLPSPSSIKHNDVLVFNYPLDIEYPVDHRTHFIKRCIGLPGDTLEITERIVYINHLAMEDPLHCQYDYHLKSDNMGKVPSQLDSLGISEGGRVSNQGDFRIATTKEIADKLRQLENIHEVSPFLEKKEIHQEYLFPYNEKFPWNIDNYGPIVIPSKNLLVHLNDSNIHLYEKIITQYEGNKLEVYNDSIYINDELTKNYTFQLNYYFVMGDNRHHSSDSRFWGFVPEDHIVGKASFVLFSINKNGSVLSKVRWERMFSKIN
jgi:signal peptidase I